MNSNIAVNAKSTAVIQTLPSFNQVVFDCDGKQIECSINTALAELKRTNRTLAEVALMDFDQAYRSDHPRSRQCQQILDALLSAGLPDPVMANKAQ